MSWVIRINGLTETDLGFVITGGAMPWSPSRRERGNVSTPGLMGQLPASVARESQRVTPVTFQAAPGSDGATLAGRQGLIDQLMAHLTGLLEVEWSDQPGRVRLCRVDDMQIRAAFERAYWVDSVADLAATVNLIEDSPVAWERETTILAIGSTPTPVPLGTAPSIPVFRFPGPFTGVTLTYRSAAGRVLSTLVVGGEPGANDHLEIDGGTFGSAAVVLSTAGVRVDRTDLYVSGDLSLTFDPTDGDPTRAFWPTIEANRPGVVEYIEAYR